MTVIAVIKQKLNMRLSRNVVSCSIKSLGIRRAEYEVNMRNFILNGAASLWLVAVIVITAMAFTACIKKSETAITISANPHSEILNRNVSEFTGTWVTSQGQSMQIKANGRLAEITGNKYIAYLADDFEADVYIIPKGIEFIHWTGAIQTDTTRDRVFIQYGSERTPTNDDVYYHVGEASTLQSNSKEPQFVYSVQFNNQTIPITVFYSVSGADGEMKNLDRMVFMYGNKEQTINLSPKVIEAGTPQGFFSYYAIPADYNFDGFLDFAVHHGHYSGWDPDIIYKVFLYNQQTANYSINEELSKLPNVRANNETQTVISIDGPVTSEYKWVSGKLELIKSESQAFSGPQ